MSSPLDITQLAQNEFAKQQKLNADERAKAKSEGRVVKYYVDMEPNSSYIQAYVKSLKDKGEDFGVLEGWHVNVEEWESKYGYV